ncbi:hypothetical protein M569_07690 [Genlisea aurea]|uniref:G3BP-like protein n=1 Tax=Genlisea aurea TaxID=192259 RepID=S8CJ88_9LAMI|nr:hypothetical protein M569_07690 [Genlisea aurea]
MAAAVETVATPVSAQVVANAFVQQYYHILHHSPGLVHRFYQEVSRLGRPEEDGSMSCTTTMQAINEKIMSLNYGDIHADIKSVDAQESHNGGVHVLVTGYLTEKENIAHKFAQAFFLAPQDNGYYVLNDIFRYLGDGSCNLPSVNDGAVSVPHDSSPIPVVEDNLSENSAQSAEVAVAEVYDPPENGTVAYVDEKNEIPVAEVTDEVKYDGERVVESNAKTEEVPKKSYASIVMHLKETAATFSPPLAAARKTPPKNVEHVNVPVEAATDPPVPVVEPVENENNQEGADGYSIYIKGLPMNATVFSLEEVFKNFGTIKNDGIQVRSNRQQGFCFGFVEFEDASSVQKALEASPVIIGGRQAFVEEKRSTNSRGNSRGRYPPGRGYGFRNDGPRGRGGYAGGRGGGGFGGRVVDFNGRNNEFSNGRNNGNNHNNHRGAAGSSNRDAYQRPENFNANGGGGGRSNNNNNNNHRPGGGFSNGNPKNLAPRVPASA